MFRQRKSIASLFQSALRGPRRRTTLHCTPLEAREVPTVGVIPDVTPSIPQETQTAAALPSTMLNGFAYFIGNDADHGTELWRSDGTAAGTSIVTDLTAGTGSTNITKIVAAGGKIVFAADPIDDVTGPQLYATDGTAAGTGLLANQAFFSEFDPNVKISVADGLVGTADAVFWSGFAENGDGSLRVTGFRTPVGGADEGQSSELAFSNQRLNDTNNFAAVPGGAVFTGNAVTGRGLFFSDGTGGALLLKSDTFDKPFQRVVPVNGGAAALRPVDAAFSDYEVIFTDGTGAGTRRIGSAAGADIALPGGTKLLGGLVSAGGKAFFTARAADGVDELWVTEGTEGSTIMLGRFNPDANDSPLRLLRTDGSKLYFPAYDSQHLGIEMWTSDGTAAGTKMVADLAPGAESSVDMYLQTADAVIPQADGIAYFLANAGGSAASDFRLYRTDGTPGGTFAIETGDTLANFAVTNQFYLGAAGGTILFRTGEQSPRLASADSSSASAVATTTSVGFSLSFSEDIGKVAVSVIAAVRDAANQPVAGSITFEFNGTSSAPVTLVDGSATIGDVLTAGEFQQLLAGNLPAVRATYRPADAQQFRPSTASAVSLVLFDESILSVSEPVLAGPAYAGATVGVISQVTVNPALASSFAASGLKIEYTAARSPDFASVTDLGRRDFATGEVVHTTSALPAAGNYFLRTNVVGPTGMVIRSTGAFTSVTEVPATTTHLELLLYRNMDAPPDGPPLYLQMRARVTSGGAAAVGSVELAFDGNARIVPVNPQGNAIAEFPFTLDSMRQLLSNGTPTFTATFTPADPGLFQPSTDTEQAIAAVDLADGSQIIASPDRPITVGEAVTLATTVTSGILPADVLGLARVKYTLKVQGPGPYIPLEPVSLAPDGTAELTGTTALLPPGRYTVTADIRSADGQVLLGTAPLTAFTLTAPQVAVGTTTRLTVTVNSVAFPFVNVDVTADVEAVSGTDAPSGTVEIRIGSRTINVPVTSGTGTVANQDLAIPELLSLSQSDGSGLTGTFVPADPADFVSSDVTGGTILLPSSLLTFTAPVLNPNHVVPGQSASIRSRVEFSPVVPAIPGLKVTFMATRPGSPPVSLATADVVNGAAQTPFSPPNDYKFPMTVALGDYELVAVLNAGDKISFGTSPGTAIRVIADTGTGYPNIPLAPKYTALATTNQVTVRDADDSVVASLPLSGDFARNAEVAVGANAAGEAVLAIGTGPGTASHVRLYTGGAQVGELDPFEASFLGGVYVAKGDLDGDGEPETIISPNLGGGPRVIVLDGKTNAVRFDFFGIDDPAFRGGARCSAGDVNGDGVADLIVAAGFQGGPRVSVYDGRSIIAGSPVKLFNDFFAFEQSLRNGIFVAVGDVDGDGYADIVAGGGPGGGPRVFAISGYDLLQSGGATLTSLANFFAGDDTNRTGVRVAVKNQNGDGRADIVTAFVGSSKARVYLTGVSEPPFLELPGDFSEGLNIG
jgi:ELWxxDGT repeat protein